MVVYTFSAGIYLDFRYFILLFVQKCHLYMLPKENCYFPPDNAWMVSLSMKKRIDDLLYVSGIISFSWSFASWDASRKINFCIRSNLHLSPRSMLISTVSIPRMFYFDLVTAQLSSGSMI